MSAYGEYAGVRILDAPAHADREYTYYIPRELSEDVRPGVFVAVPFGGGNRKKTALVVNVYDSTDVERCKPISETASPGVVMSSEMLGICDFLCSQTLCTYGDAVRATVPQGAMSRVRELYEAAADTEVGESVVSGLSAKAMYVYAFVQSHGRVTYDRIRAEFGDAAVTNDLLSSLCRRGLLRKSHDLHDPTNEVVDADIRLAVSDDDAEAYIADRSVRSKRSKDIVSYLLSCGGGCSESELKSEMGAVTTQLRSLCERGVLTREERRVFRNPFASIPESPTALTLSPEQTCARDALVSLYESGEAKAALLFGVTGSGKTSVIRSMIDRVTSDGRGVIILVPEIALTPQTVSIFCSNYGSRVAVIHSSLSAGERIDAWQRIRDGGADIVIGTRSAIFAPVKNLGMIVIDEEQEHTYKSDSAPKYTAHDVARYRCAQNNALMLLSSATPSLSTYHKARTGAYTLVELRERYGGARLPDVIVADMRRDRVEDSTSPIGKTLRAAIGETVARGEQAILFLNRRGYNNFLSCRSCGSAVVCPRCSVALTYHASRKIAATDDPENYRAEHIAAGYLECHYCGYRTSAPRACPECGSENMYYMGWGTQRVEQELGELYPTARILRMDADTTRTRSAYDEILGAFGRHEADILIGTQMVTKGHDFPDVTLVGVLLAESSLYLDDYRASERTFSLITQVVGRAGRASLPGRAIIQTYTPDNKSLGYACAQDYESFYDNEIKLRRAYSFPPFCDIAQVTLTSADEAELSQSVLRLSEYMKQTASTEYSDVPLLMFGPFEAPVYRINGKCRMRIVCKCKLTKRTRALFASVLTDFAPKLTRRVSVAVDFNPNSV